MSWPSMAYHATLEIEKRLTPESTIWEWGCLNWIVWFAERCKHITSVEHDLSNYLVMAARVPSNCNIIYASLSAGYYVIGGKYDMIIVNGRKRVMCVRKAIPCLKMGGTLVLDDSWRYEYKAAMEMLRDWPSETWEENRGCPSIEKGTTLFTKTEEREPAYYDAILEQIGIPDEMA